MRKIYVLFFFRLSSAPLFIFYCGYFPRLGAVANLWSRQVAGEPQALQGHLLALGPLRGAMLQLQLLLPHSAIIASTAD